MEVVGPAGDGDGRVMGGKAAAYKEGGSCEDGSAASAAAAVVGDGWAPDPIPAVEADNSWPGRRKA